MKDYKALLTTDSDYHIFNRAVGGEKIFAIPENYSYFLLLFEKYIVPLADVFCYCLLPNHFHFFIRTKDGQTLGEEMKRLDYKHADSEAQNPAFILQQFSNFFNAYTKALNKQQHRKGKLFMEPFNRRCVTTPEYHIKLIHYIHANPVHHGFCKSVDQLVV